MGCLYRITMPGPRVYLGITTKTASERFGVHQYHARKGSRSLLHLSITKHGASAALVETLVVADDWKYLCDLERRAIAAFGTRAPNGLNLTDGGDGASAGSAHHAGFKHSPETKAKMSAAKLGVKRSPEHCAKISAALLGNKYTLGRTLSDAHKQAISASNTGKVWSEESRERMRQASLKREALHRARRT
jgi:hypothetical protein